MIYCLKTRLPSGCLGMSLNHSRNIGIDSENFPQRMFLLQLFSLRQRKERIRFLEIGK